MYRFDYADDAFYSGGPKKYRKGTLWIEKVTA